jgi:HTH-type transcriptional regulator/antitoxin HigA
MATKYSFAPDYIIPPGETLKETLEAKGMSQTDLAVRTGMADKTVSQIINGLASISYEIAEKLEMATGVPASFWNRRELSYQEALTRAEEKQKLEAEIGWLKEIPVRELVDREFIEHKTDKACLVREVLKFFGVSSVEAWRNTWGRPAVQFRGKTALDRHPGFVAAWLRMGEIQAEQIQTEAFDAGEFKRALLEARGLTREDASVWSVNIPKSCAAAGVAVVFTKEIPSASVSGATRWLTKDKALLQLSLKYKTDDQLWFTFFHEAGHILLHGKKQMFVEFGINDETEEEREANEFSRNWLIPRDIAHLLPQLKTKASINRFAEEYGIAPGIVVGRMEHDKLAHPSFYHDLKRKLQWS